MSVVVSVLVSTPTSSSSQVKSWSLLLLLLLELLSFFEQRQVFGWQLLPRCLTSPEVTDCEDCKPSDEVLVTLGVVSEVEVPSQESLQLPTEDGVSARCLL